MFFLIQYKTWYILHSRNICIRVEPKHFRCINRGKTINEIKVLLYVVTFWNDVAFVKVECWEKHVVTEPNLREKDEMRFNWL